MSTGAGLITAVVVLLICGCVAGTFVAYLGGRQRAAECASTLSVPAHRHAFDRAGNVWDQCR